MDDKNLFTQVKVAMQARLYNFWDFLRTLFKYWRNLQFASIDRRLLLSYFWKSPYSIGREECGEPYGETPLATMEKIATLAAIGPEDIVYELGSGRGRTSFWLACFRHCKVVGIDCNPVFIEKAKKIKCPGTAFLCRDYLSMNMSPATVIYLYGTLLEDAEILAFCKKCKELKKGTRIITISYPLQEYIAEPLFELQQEFEVEFQWGKTQAYLQCKV